MKFDAPTKTRFGVTKLTDEATVGIADALRIGTSICCAENVEPAEVAENTKAATPWMYVGLPTSNEVDVLYKTDRDKSPAAALPPGPATLSVCESEQA